MRRRKKGREKVGEKGKGILQRWLWRGWTWGEGSGDEEVREGKVIWEK